MGKVSYKLYNILSSFLRNKYDIARAVMQSSKIIWSWNNCPEFDNYFNLENTSDGEALKKLRKSNYEYFKMLYTFNDKETLNEYIINHLTTFPSPIIVLNKELLNFIVSEENYLLTSEEENIDYIIFTLIYNSNFDFYNIVCDFITIRRDNNGQN